MNNTATPNTVGSKKYVSISSPGLGGSQTMQNSQGYNFKQKANSPNNYNSQGGQSQMYSNNVNTSALSNNTSG